VALYVLWVSWLACYQLLFCTPGNSPACAISRRQILHSPNLR
jgi:hypothetical protein